MAEVHGTKRIARAAVIGLGAMGRHHVRIYDSLPNVDLVAVCDMDPAAVEREVAHRGARGYTDVERMLDEAKPDIVSVVVPTVLHYKIAMLAIERNVNVLVEKPIAISVGEAESMIAAAKDAGVHLMVGHIERFNPAIQELKRRVDQVGTVFQAFARRVGPFPDRIHDVGVVIDLASHDIDAMNYILDSPVDSVFALTARNLHQTHEDLLVGSIKFRNGVIGALDVNWLTSTKVRELTIVGSNGTFIANYLTQDLQYFENGSREQEWENLESLQKISEGHAIRYHFSKQEPLKVELSQFVQSVLDGTAVPATPESAANALSIALSMMESGRTGKSISPHLLETLEGNAF